MNSYHFKIATLLNQEFVPTRENGSWDKFKVRLIVQNPTYVGRIWPPFPGPVVPQKT